MVRTLFYYWYGEVLKKTYLQNLNIYVSSEKDKGNPQVLDRKKGIRIRALRPNRYPRTMKIWLQKAVPSRGWKGAWQACQGSKPGPGKWWGGWWPGPWVEGSPVQEMKSPGLQPTWCRIWVHITCMAQETQARQLTKMDLEPLKTPEFPTETNAKPLSGSIFTASDLQDSREKKKKQSAKEEFTVKDHDYIE